MQFQINDKAKALKQLTVFVDDVGHVIESIRIMNMPSDCYEYGKCLKLLLHHLSKAGFGKGQDSMPEYGPLWLCRAILAAEMARAQRTLTVYEEPGIPHHLQIVNP